MTEKKSKSLSLYEIIIWQIAGIWFLISVIVGNFLTFYIWNFLICKIEI